MTFLRVPLRARAVLSGALGVTAILTGLTGGCIPDIVLKSDGTGGAAASTASGSGGIGGDGSGGATSSAGGGDTTSSAGGAGTGGSCDQPPIGMGCHGLKFDGSGTSYGALAVGVPSGLSAPDSPKMIGAWVRLSSDGFTGTVFAMGNEQNCNDPDCWGGALRLLIVSGKPAVSAGKAGHFAAQKTIPLNTWTYVYAGFDKGQDNGYFAGQLGLNADHQATPNIGTTSTNHLTPFEPVRIGVDSGGLSPFKGEIDRIEVYSPAPTGPERQSWSQMKPNALVASSSKLFWLWSLDESDPATTTIDARRCATATITWPQWWDQPAPAGCPPLAQ